MEQAQHKNLGYGTYLLVFLGLTLLLFLSIASTQVDVGVNLVAASMIISVIQAVLVLSIYMHLRFTSRMYTVMILVVMITYIAVVIVTFFDYLFR